ncbi:MAG: alanine--tRNA ligase [Candidatus Eremiobacteraeota bacterium]|nr:alanine--tRNA ligase [Candidatus Eremiobacteraeota bacterium]MBC5801733.1 alanine--tRNA ligase [Candidatus Eremiobacteraeota bacterium]MBC5821519.1 alanine--tRNA ligase [Candidatus Eremiobacteraeota bacterium]
MRFSSQEVRRSFVEFFVSQGHVQAPAASLVPDTMSNTLFTIAGMEQFVPAFLGEAPPPAPRVVTVQRCLRVAGAKSDIENVGRTGRHGTFLEMLGNFSFGDYYKRDAIVWAWEYVTSVIGLEPAKLYVTVHENDDDAAVLWQREVGLEAARITRFGDENFWTMGPTGPCGPSSEIFYDTGAQHASSPSDVGPNRGDRFVEIWNLVFQQYNRAADGTLAELRTKNIDTGAGFERLLAIANGAASMYETDLFTDLIAAQPAVGRTSLGASEQLVRRRIIADHARAATFLVADGVYPSNTDRGYVLRFLVRRAIRNGKLLGYPSGFLTELVPPVVASLTSGYPQLETARSKIEHALGAEELIFNRTLERGNAMLAELLRTAQERGGQLAGSDVFVLHDTYGFPAELTREIAAEAHVPVDLPGFEAEMEQQRERARADAHKKRAVVSVADLPATVSQFTGYDGLEADGRVLSLLRDGRTVDSITVGDEAQVVLDSTSFYAEKGGQIGDHGVLEYIDRDGRIATFVVTDTQYAGEAIAHRGVMRDGALSVGDAVHTAVDPAWREEIRRHHTSAHLLQRALKDVLGDEVVQAGSWVGIDRMRFDFRSPGGALTPEQRRDVVARVNAMIRDDHHAHTQVMTAADAAASGAISMAGEHYGDAVRVIRFGPSLEFCGGTHAHTTGELGVFLILSEASIGSGIRRIEAVVSKAAENYVLEQQELVGSLAQSLSARPGEVMQRVERLQSDVRELQQALAGIKARLASADAATYVGRAETIGGKRVVAAVVPEADAMALKELADGIKQRMGSGVVALAGTDGQNVALLVAATADVVAAGVHAGTLLKTAAPLVEGRGGGQAAQAQGGGKNPAGAEAALDAIRAALAE